MTGRGGWMAVLLLCAAASVSAAETPATMAVRRVIDEQQAAWNRGDIDAFMQGYRKSDDIRFAGGDSFHAGWQTTLDRYRRTYPDAAAMGKLDFELIEVREFSPVVVYVFGKWRLTRAADQPGAAPHGLFTLIFERRAGTWAITRDHTSDAGH